MNEQLVVVAIHGTFAERAAWTQPDSVLHRAMITQLTGVDVEWKEFRWGSWNNSHERREAANELRRAILRVRDSHPEARVALLAHSHGGNVALMALRSDSRLQQVVDAVVCLATPFIVPDKPSPEWLGRRLRELFLALWIAMVAIPCAVISIALYRSIGDSFSGWFPIGFGILLHQLYRAFIGHIPTDKESLRFRTPLLPYDYTSIYVPVLSMSKT
jgi:pimeloyl-ACP methyl ester carboxylesterase